MNRLVPLLFAAIAGASCSTSFDVGPRADADPTTDAGPVVEGGRTTCAGADFCADFETGPVESGWDDTNQQNGGTVALDSTRGFGSARSASSRTVPGSDESVYASLDKRLDGARRLTIDLDIWMTTPDWRGCPNFGVIGVAMGSRADTTAYFNFIINRGSISAAAQVPDLTGTESAEPFPYARWVHVTYAVDWDARSTSVSLDGKMTVSHHFIPTMDIGTDPNTSVQIGFNGFNPPQPDVTVSIDNVVINGR